MRTQKIATVAALAIPLIFGGHGRSLHAQPAPGTPVAYDDDDHNRGRDAREIGHRDGMRAAEDDIRDRRRADADAHRDYKNPPVDKRVRDEYRAGFRDGYNDGMRNATQGYRR